MNPFIVKFSVPAIPVAQPRQRHRLAHVNGTTVVKNYTPTDSPVNSFKATVRLAAQEKYDGAPNDEPLKLELLYVMPRPKSMMWKKREMPRVFCGHGKDLDNLEKSVMDALTGILWKNDSQVCWKMSRKVIASGTEQPHVVVEVSSLKFLDCGYGGPSVIR